ncbi:peptidase S41 [Labrys monachus]|uniref:Peptidase S41 n=1 Tax=Labrys monachus TaxID=217067 RepID=A0ABU0FN77_9HYPH|nr:peptidase S41 [Labrys monachus]MDQ0396071.1 hypothetical protein [Labrys monachus]
MRLNRRQWMQAASAALASLTAGRSARAETPPSRLSPGRMMEDLDYLRTQWAPLDRSFSERQRQILDGVIAEAGSRVASLSVEDFALYVMRAAAIPRNGHTTALVGRLLGSLPIRTWWFADGLHIVSAQPQFPHVLGARVEKLGGMTPDEALAAVAPFISGTDQRIRYLSAAYLTSPAVLRRIGAVPDAAEIPVTLRLADGGLHRASLGAATAPDPGDGHDPVFSGWSALIPDDPDMPGRWPHVLDGIDTRSPVYAKPTDLSTTWMGSAGKVLYVRSNYLRSQGQDARYQGWVFGVLQGLVVPKQPQAVIVDLRLNNGGNFFDTLLFAQALPKLMPAGGRVFVLIGRATFSAALVTAAMLKGAGPDKVIFIGEPMGDNGHFWAEPGTKILPNSGITVFYSTRFEDYEHGCSDPGQCYWPTIAFGPRNISLAPDIAVDVSFSDYAAGRDPVLERALAMADRGAP